MEDADNDILDIIGEDVLGNDKPINDCSDAIVKLREDITALKAQIVSDTDETVVEDEPKAEEVAEVTESPEEEVKDSEDDKKDLITWEELGGEVIVTKDGIKLVKKEAEKLYPYPEPGKEPQAKESSYPAPESNSTDSKIPKIDSVDGRKFFHDSIELDTESSILEDGNLTVDAVIAKEIVQEYEDNGKTIKVYKPADELKKSSDILSTYPRPVTDEHPAAKVVTSADEIKGVTSNVQFIENSIPCKLNVKDKSVIDSIQTGVKRDVSIGFYSDLEYNPGKVSIDGKEIEYDAIQRNILIDHVAITKDGRCSSDMGCGIKLDDGGELSRELREKMDSLFSENKLLKDSLTNIENTESTRLKGKLLALTDYYDEKRVNDMPLSELHDKIDFVKGVVADKSLGIKDSSRLNYKEELDKVLR